MMSLFILLAVVVAAGAILSVQAAINGRLGETVGVLRSSLLTFFGGLNGLILGIVFVVLQQKLALIMITPSRAYPIEFEILNVVIVMGTILLLGFLASWIASSRVSKNLLD